MELRIEVNSNLGPVGLGLAADELEKSADEIRILSVMHAESLQFAADFLREAAALMTGASARK